MTLEEIVRFDLQLVGVNETLRLEVVRVGEELFVVVLC